jgi:hypothetical protein
MVPLKVNFSCAVDENISPKVIKVVNKILFNDMSNFFNKIDDFFSEILHISC